MAMKPHADKSLIGEEDNVFYKPSRPRAFEENQLVRSLSESTTELVGHCFLPDFNGY
jgi:hypothetical protein